MSIIAGSNQRIAAAQRHMLALQEKLRVDTRVLKNSWCATLTQPWVIGGVALAGWVVSARGRSAPVQVECKCKTPGPAIMRSLITALLVPMVKQWIGAARQQSTVGDPASRPTASAIAKET